MSTYQVKYISNSCGVTDELQNKPHESVAKSLYSLLTTHDEIKHPVIGLEGSWGSGKSRVINILQHIANEGNAQTRYVFHTYDIWSAQEDLTRRSFLDSVLAKAKSTPGHFNTAQIIIDYERLNATVTRRSTKTYPLVRLFYATALLIPISVFVVKALEHIIGYRDDASMTYDQLAALLSVFFFIISIVLFVIAFYDEYKSISKDGDAYKDDKRCFPISRLALSRILYLYKAKDIEKEDLETVIKDEPSISRFQDYFNHVKEALNDNTRLVIVFDNMDRLSDPQKLMSTWSLLHTFFAEGDNEGRIWALVPFARQQLATLMKTQNNKYDAHYAEEFINKTFFTTFRIPEPILDSWKHFLNEKLDAAFNPNLPPEEKNLVALIFSRSMAGRTIRPRDIITYVNRLVTLYSQHYFEEIPVRFLALFAQFESQFAEHATKTILEFTGFESMTGLFNSRSEISKMLASIYYNLPTEKALEVVFDKEITDYLQHQYRSHQEREAAFTRIAGSSSYSSHIEEYFNRDIDYKEFHLANVFYLLERTDITSETRQRIYTDVADNAERLKDTFFVYQNWMEYAFLHYSCSSTNELIKQILNQPTVKFTGYCVSVVSLLLLKEKRPELSVDLESLSVESVDELLYLYNHLQSINAFRLYPLCKVTIEESVLLTYMQNGKSSAEIFGKEVDNLYGLLLLMKHNGYVFKKTLNTITGATNIAIANHTTESVRRIYKVFDIIKNDFASAPSFTVITDVNASFYQIPEYLAACVNKLKNSTPKAQLAARCFSNIQALPDTTILTPVMARSITLDNLLLTASESNQPMLNTIARNLFLSELAHVDSIFDMLTDASGYLTGVLKGLDDEFIRLLDANHDKFSASKEHGLLTISPYFCDTINHAMVTEHPIYADILNHWQTEIDSYTEDDWISFFMGEKTGTSNVIIKIFQEDLYEGDFLSRDYVCRAATRAFCDYVTKNTKCNEQLLSSWKAAVNPDQVSTMINEVYDNIQAPSRIEAIRRYAFIQTYVSYSSRISNESSNASIFDDFIKSYFTSAPIESVAQHLCDCEKRYFMLADHLDSGRLSTWHQILGNRLKEITENVSAHTKWVAFAEYLQSKNPK